MKKPTKRSGNAGISYKGLTTTIIAFPLRRSTPSTISNIVDDYKSVRVPKGAYYAPLPVDFREVQK